VASAHWSYIHTHFGVGYRFAPEIDNGHDPEAEREPMQSTVALDPALAE
jgi:hypothetical protein